MEWFIIIVAAGAAGIAAKGWRKRVATRRTQDEELEAVRRLADEDVTEFGEQLRRLDREAVGRILDEDVRVAHQTAHDCYTSAQRVVSRVTIAEDVSKVTETVATGRYALACVQAFVVGQSVPEHRVVCFFDPRHGLSVTDVLWNRPGHGPRRLPACAGDAQRIANKQAPEVRTAKLGARTLPYWSAGAAFIPYTRGYFASEAALSWALRPAAIEMAPQAPGYFGTGIVGSSGHFDGGGFDGSGANP